MDPSTFLGSVWNINLLQFGGLSTFSDSVWIHREYKWFIALVSILMAADPLSLIGNESLFSMLKSCVCLRELPYFSLVEAYVCLSEIPIPFFFWLKLRFGCEIEIPRNSSFFRETKSTFQRPRSFSPLGSPLRARAHWKWSSSTTAPRAWPKSWTRRSFSDWSVDRWSRRSVFWGSYEFLTKKNSSHDMIFDIISFWWY